MTATLQGGWNAATVWWGLVALMLVAIVPTTAALVLDPRVLDGAPIWAKPLKFELSLAIHFATLALVVQLLSPGWRHGSLLLVVAVVSTAAALFEIVYILLQAGRGLRSHFNLSTPLYAALYSAMAVGAVLIVTASAIVGAVVGLDRAAAMPPALRVGIVLGLVGGSLLTLVTAFTIGARLDRLVGVEAEAAARMWGTGWSLTVGDLRVAHFLATHMIQAIPLIALLTVAFLPPIPAVAIVVVSGAGWAVLTLAAWRQALAGVPFWPVSLS